jgi:hypothetical protein
MIVSDNSDVTAVAVSINLEVSCCEIYQSGQEFQYCPAIKEYFR